MKTTARNLLNVLPVLLVIAVTASVGVAAETKMPPRDVIEVPSVAIMLQTRYCVGFSST